MSAWDGTVLWGLMSRTAGRGMRIVLGRRGRMASINGIMIA
jgi:hypothetical protein